MNFIHLALSAFAILLSLSLASTLDQFLEMVEIKGTHQDGLACARSIAPALFQNTLTSRLPIYHSGWALDESYQWFVTGSTPILTSDYCSQMTLRQSFDFYRATEAYKAGCEMVVHPEFKIIYRGNYENLLKNFEDRRACDDMSFKFVYEYIHKRNEIAICLSQVCTLSLEQYEGCGLFNVKDAKDGCRQRVINAISN